jgi:O-antigen/teichoic acid export membrane protein
VPISTQRSTSGITGRIVRAAGAQIVNQLARIVQLFLLVPICLTAWGTAAYEDWLLLQSIAAFLVLADLGFVQFTTVKLIDAWSKGEGQRFSREWAISLGILVVISALLCLALGLCWAAPVWTTLVPTREFHATEIAAVAVLLSLAQVAGISIIFGLAAYRARGDLSRSYHVSSILVGLQTAGVAVPALLGYGPVGAAAGMCILTSGMLAMVVVDLSLRYPEITWKPAWPSFAELSARVRESVGYVAFPVSTTIMVNGPTLILAQSGAPEGAIALFTVTRTLAGVARQLPYQFAHPAGVELAALLACGDRQGLHRLYERASRALAIIVGLLSGGSLVVAPLVMALWTRGKIDYDPILMLFLVGTTSICAPAQVAYTFLWYGGHPRPLNKALAISTGLAMGLAALLVRWFEARGVAAGLGAGEIVGMAIYLPLAVDRILERKRGTGLVQNFWVTLGAFLGSAGSGYLIWRLLGPSGWLGLVEFGCAWAIPAAIGVYWTLVTREQKARMGAVAASFLRPRRAKPPGERASPADLG